MPPSFALSDGPPSPESSRRALDAGLPVPSVGVVFQPVPGGAVLLDTGTEVYFGLNATGARIWELLAEPGIDGPRVCTRLMEEFADATPELVRADVDDVLAGLLASGLVRAGETR